MDSFLEAVLSEPERFLAYIKNWKKIFTLNAFIKSFRRAFGFHHTGKNVYGSSDFKLAMKMLWENSYTQKQVTKNFERIGQKYEQSTFQKEYNRIKKLMDIPDLVKMDISVHTKSGKVYNKSYRRWTPREKLWMQKNKQMPLDSVYEIFNSLFSSPRTKKSIEMKRRRV